VVVFGQGQATGSEAVYTHTPAYAWTGSATLGAMWCRPLLDKASRFQQRVEVQSLYVLAVQADRAKASCSPTLLHP
jgi:hypothetical protein